MILAGEESGERATLDDLFRRAGVRHPEAIALADAPNRARIDGSAPRQLTYAEVDRAAAALAAALHGSGLSADAVVALHLPNTVDSVVALLGVLRAGMIAVPIPLLWRTREIIEALRPLGAKALLTCRRAGRTDHSAIAMHVAAELFPIRMVGAFGRDVPDGMLPLDDVFTAAPSEIAGGPQPAKAAARIAVVTFEIRRDGVVPIARSHAQVIAGGRAVLETSGIAAGTRLISTIPVSSFAGFAAVLVPWLVSGGALDLHHGFEPAAFRAQVAAQPGGAVVVPAAALAPFAAGGLFAGAGMVFALWRAPEHLASAARWAGEPALIDVAVFGEIGVIPSRRDSARLPRPQAESAPGVVELLRTKASTLALRGAMVPTHAFPPGAEHGHEPCLAADAAGFVDTGFTGRFDGQGFTVSGAPGGLISVGGYRFRPPALDELVSVVDPAAAVIALPHALLGQRLAGTARDPALTAAGLAAYGAPPLVTAAFGPHGGKRRRDAA